MKTTEIAEGLKISILDNGVRVVTDYFPKLESVALTASFSVGSCAETEENNGVAHFLEHILFKDSANASGVDRSVKIAEAGGFMNAVTQKDMTNYDVSILREDGLTALDTIADMICEPIFDAEQIETERNVILQEDCRGCLSCTLRESFYAQAFPEQAISMPIIGSDKSIKAISKADLMQFHADYYTCDNLIVAASGDIEHDAYVEAVARKFARLPLKAQRPSPRFEYVGGEACFGSSNDQGTIWFGFPGRPFQMRTSMAEAVFWKICGSGPTSRLFRELREKRGLVYDASTWTEYDGRFRMRLVEATADKDEIRNVFQYLVDTLHQTAAELEEGEVAREKTSLIASGRMSRDRHRKRIDTAIGDLIYEGRIFAPADDYAEIRAVDLAAVKQAGQDLLARAPTLAAYGSIRKLPKLAQLQGKSKVQGRPKAAA